MADLIGQKVRIKRQLLFMDHRDSDFVSYDKGGEVGVIIKEMPNVCIDGGEKYRNPKFKGKAYLVKWRVHELCMTYKELELMN